MTAAQPEVCLQAAVPVICTGTGIKCLPGLIHFTLLLTGSSCCLEGWHVHKLLQVERRQPSALAASTESCPGGQQSSGCAVVSVDEQCALSVPHLAQCITQSIVGLLCCCCMVLYALQHQQMFCEAAWASNSLASWFTAESDPGRG